MFDTFKWFCKYWYLKAKYDELERKFNELINLHDDEFWEWVKDEQ